MHAPPSPSHHARTLKPRSRWLLMTTWSSFTGGADASYGAYVGAGASDSSVTYARAPAGGALLLGSGYYEKPD